MGNITKSHGAKVAQRGNPRTGRRGNNRAQNAFWHFTVIVLFKEFNTGFGRPHAQTINGFDFSGFCHPNHDRRDSGKINQIAMQNAQCNTRSDTRIDRIAAGLKHCNACVGGQAMT